MGEAALIFIISDEMAHVLYIGSVALISMYKNINISLAPVVAIQNTAGQDSGVL